MACSKIRFTVLALCVAACFFTSITRYNLNIALVDMTSNHSSVSKVNLTNIEHRSKYIDQAFNSLTPILGTESRSSSSVTRYHWDQQVQGLLLGSLYWTYMIFQIPSGVIVERFGSRWIVTVSLIASGIINIITPLITGSTAAFIATRLALGIFQAGCFPGSYALLVKWMPLYERSFAFSLLRVGAVFGSVATALASGIMCESLGWPSVFYVAGILSLVGGLVVAVCLREYPEEHPWITQKELSIIKSAKKEDTGEEKTKPPIPWFKIFTSPAILSYGFFKFALFWVFFSLSTKLPTYLSSEKGMDIGSNGVTNSLFNLSYGISLTITGYLSDRVIERKLLSRTATRKSFSIVTGFGSAFCLIFVPFVSSPNLMHFLLYFSGICLGFSSGGDVPLSSEMSKNFPATIFALINMFSMISGCTSPSFAGIILTSFSSHVAWPIIFVSASLTMVLATVIFLIFATAERLTFDIEADGPKLPHATTVST